MFDNTCPCCGQQMPEQQSKDGFPGFWLVYPKKIDKQAARKAWDKMKLDPMADKLVQDVVTRVAVHKAWRDGFIPNPATYLNGRRWEDDLDRVAHVSAPTSGSSPRREETPQTKLQGAISYAEGMINMGVWDKARARDYVAEQKTKLGVP